MPLESTHDVRVVLVRDKYFSLRPKPLERWLWKQSIAPSAERVFWLHWEEGHRNGTWCSEIPLRRVAAECCLDVSTVTRAYQQLASLDLVRRQDPGRDPRNPFQQATALTEVRLPRELVCELERHPNRRKKDRTDAIAVIPAPAREPAPTAAPVSSPAPRRSHREVMRELSALENKMSPGELTRFREAMRTHTSHIAFDDESRLGADDRAAVLDWLQRLARRPPESTPSLSARQGQASIAAVPRKLSLFELARVRRELTRCRPAEEVSELLRQVIWAIDQGALSKFTPLHAANIALKKIRDGLWSRPNRMPPNWIPTRGFGAHTEQCGTA